MDNITKIISSGTKYLNKLSLREKGVMLMLVAVLMTVSLAYLYGLASLRFGTQGIEMAAVGQEAKLLQEALHKYLDLRARRDTIEKQFHDVEFKEGVKSHIEHLAEQKAGIASKDITITDGPAVAFGDKYQQQPYTVRFETINIGGLVEFLRALVEGQKPLMLSLLHINKNAANRLTVNLTLSSIRRIS